MSTRLACIILLSALLSACGATRTAAWDVELQEQALTKQCWMSCEHPFLQTGTIELNAQRLKLHLPKW